MKKVNLEEVLLKQNRKVLVPSELLLIEEYNNVAHNVTNDALTRIGIGSIEDGRKVAEKTDKQKSQTELFNQERVFHISQIESLCKKYGLRFLPPNLYKGQVDPKLADKVAQTEIAYSIKCNQYNTKITAPPSSFKLEPRPKDPLFFYEINESYYYLIYKWGNDLSFKRRLMVQFLYGWGIIVLFLAIIVAGIVTIVMAMNADKMSPNQLTFLGILTVIFVAMAAIVGHCNDTGEYSQEYTSTTI